MHWPHVINYRDPECEDTVLHYCARQGLPTAVTAWVSGSGVSFAPLENGQGLTAVREAVDNQQSDTAKELLRMLDPHAGP